jgi:uncharacterized membrane protein YbhN (UPF0104 family)
MTNSSASAGTPEEGSSGLLHRIATVPTPIVFIGSVLVAVVLLWQSGSFGDAFDAARDANYLTLVAGFVVYVAGLAILCLRWDLIVRMIKGASNVPRAAEAFLTSVVINYAAPIGLAVPTRAALTKRALGLSATETGAAVLWEIAVDVLVLGMGSAIWLLANSRDLSAPSSGQVLAGAGVLIAGLLILGLVVFWLRMKPARWQRVRSGFKEAILLPRQRPGAAALALSVTVAYWVVQAIVMALFIRSLGGDSTVKLILGLITVPVLVGMLSPVPGGAGIREALMIGVARVEGADTAVVLVAALVYRVALFLAIPLLYLGVRIWLKAEGEAAIEIEEFVHPAERGTIASTSQGEESPR